jgi:uncharacterized membrane protein YkoI
MKHLKLITAVALAGALVVGCESESHEQAELAAQPKITRDDATRIALAKVPNGNIKEAELEKEKGKVIWSFDVATPGTKDITEVNVDAISGDIVDVSVESAKDEAKEKD